MVSFTIGFHNHGEGPLVKKKTVCASQGGNFAKKKSAEVSQVFAQIKWLSLKSLKYVIIMNNCIPTLPGFGLGFCSGNGSGFGLGFVIVDIAVVVISAHKPL